MNVYLQIWMGMTLGSLVGPALALMFGNYDMLRQMVWRVFDVAFVVGIAMLGANYFS